MLPTTFRRYVSGIWRNSLNPTFLSSVVCKTKAAAERPISQIGSCGRKFSTSVIKEVPFPDGVLIKYDTYPEGIPRMEMMRSGYFLDYWKVAKVMHSKGLIPLVHGQSQLFRIPYEILKFLKFSQGEFLRVPTPYFQEKSKEAHQQLELIQKHVSSFKIFYSVLHKFPSFISRAGRIDHMAQFSPFLLSANIGLGQGYDESALSYVFGGPAHKFDLHFSGNRSRLSHQESVSLTDKMIEEALTLRNYSDGKIQKIVSRLSPFYTHATTLKVGQLFVIGVPVKKMTEWTYASAPFGVNTGCNMDEVLKTFSIGKIPRKADQVRLILNEQSLHKEDGVKVVNLMDEIAISEFCKDHPESPAKEEFSEHAQTITDKKKRESLDLLVSELQLFIQKTL